MSAVSQDLHERPIVSSSDSRTQIVRGSFGGRGWELWLRKPAPQFVGLLAGLWAGSADTSLSRHRVLPNGELWLMFNLGPPERMLPVAGTSSGQVVRRACICGLQDRPFLSECIGRHPCVVAARLLPLGAWALFRGMPLIDLANQTLVLESVLGNRAGVDSLWHQLLESPHLGAALDLVEDWLLARLVAGPAGHPSTRGALERLSSGRSELRVEALARELGVSARYVNGLFHRQVGLPVKSLARILRFERAQDHLIRSGDGDLAALALECGYYDQSHLNRDFRELADLTPTEYLARVFVLPGWREIGG